MSPLEPTTSITHRTDKDGRSVSLSHSPRGCHSGWWEALSRQGELDGGGGTRQSDLRGWPSLDSLVAPGLLPLLPSPSSLGPDLRCKWCPRWLLVAELCSRRSSGRRQAALGIVLTGGSVAYDGGSSPPWVVAARATCVDRVGWAHSRWRSDPRGGGAACATVQRLAPPCRSTVSSWLLRPLAAGGKAWWATVRCALTSAASDGRRVDGCRGGPWRRVRRQRLLGFLRSPRSLVAGSFGWLHADVSLVKLGL
jgi:hypothetical protein